VKRFQRSRTPGLFSNQLHLKQATLHALAGRSLVESRTLERYKALLQAADEHRRGDSDGRGNLTQAGLIDWINYTLDVCIDQVELMIRQLDINGMRDRIEAALAFDAAAVKSGVRPEALIPLHYLFATQVELGRAEFKAMTGLGDRIATETVSSLVRRGFVATDSPYGRLRFAVPRHALRPSRTRHCSAASLVPSPSPDAAASRRRTSSSLIRSGSRM
jgi:hypothetical protein